MSKWLRLALTIVFVGGIMVSFLYVASLAINQKLIFNFSTATFIVLSLSLLGYQENLSHTLTVVAQPVRFFSTPAYPSTIILVAYLLFILLVVVGITESFKGSLVQRF